MSHTTFLHSHLELLKYPSTLHLQGSKCPPGDNTQDQVPYRALLGHHLVVEEKLDGANSGVSFSAAGDLLLQSRGHYLSGGGRERQFSVFKHWAAAHEAALLERLDDRYVMFGEWLHKKHSIFYDRLPHYFNEFDVYDRQQQCFLSTAARARLLHGSPVLSVPVLYTGPAPKQPAELLGLLRPSLAKSTQWREVFARVVQQSGHALARCWAQTDSSDWAEGLYIKVEEGDRVLARYKWVQPGFIQTLTQAGSHHLDQPYIPNQLAAGVDLYAATPTCTWLDLGLSTRRA